MAKIAFYITCSILIIFGISCSNPSPNLVPVQASMLPTKKVVVVKKDVYEVLDSLFDAQVKIKEATGRNDGYWVEQFQKSVNLKRGDAWCAAYAAYNLKFLKERGFNVEYIKSGYSPNWAFNKHRIWKTKQPYVPFKFGDVFTLYFVEMGRAAHVGFILKDGDSHVVTQEGNTSVVNEGTRTREGDGVERKRRLKKQLYTVGRFIKDE